MIRYFLQAIIISHLLLVGLSAAAFADNDAVEGLYLQDFDKITQLSHQSVQAIVQDQSGYLWFGTSRGLNRYDGRQITNYYVLKEQGRDIPIYGVECLALDTDGTVLVGTMDAGLLVIPPDSAELVQVVADLPAVNAIVPLQRSCLLATDQGVYLYDRKDKQTKIVLGIDENQAYGKAVLLPNGRVIIAFSRKSMVAIYNPVDGTSVIYSLPGVAAWEVASDFHIFPNGRYLILTSRGRLLLNNGNADEGLRAVEIPGFPSPLPGTGQKATDMLVANGVLYIATLQGLLSTPLNEDGLPEDHPDSQHFYPSEAVSTLFADTSGILWVSSQYRLRKAVLHNDSFMIITPEGYSPDRPENIISIYDIDFSSDGTLWAGAKSGGLYFRHNDQKHLHPGAEYSEKLDRYTHSEIRSLFINSADVLWFSTDGHLVAWDLKNEILEEYPIPLNSGSLLRLRFIKPMADGTIMIGTQNDGIRLFDVEKRRLLKSGEHALLELEKYYRGSGVYDVHIDRPGNTWLALFQAVLKIAPDGTLSDTWRFDPASTQVQTAFDVYDFHDDPSGYLWMATTRGLKRYDPEDNSFRTYRFGNVTSAFERIFSILGDSQGRLWIGGKGNLILFEPDRGAFRRFNTNHGMLIREFNLRSYDIDVTDLFYMGGLGGIVAYNPDQFTMHTYSARCALNEVLVNGEPVQLEKRGENWLPLSVEGEQKVLEFRVGVFDYNDPSSNALRYRLIESSPAWIDNGNNMHFVLSGLSAGAYTLEIQGMNSDDIPTRNTIIIPLHIRPYVWNTAWFRLLVTSLAILIIVGILFYRNRVLRSVNRELQQKNRAIEETARDLKTFDYSVSNALKAPLRRILAYSEMLQQQVQTDNPRLLTDYARKTMKNASEMHSLLDSLMMLSRVKNVEPERFLIHASEVLKTVAAELKEHNSLQSVALLMQKRVTIKADVALTRYVFKSLLESMLLFKKRNVIHVQFDVAELDGSRFLRLQEDGFCMDSPDLPQMFEPFHNFHTMDSYSGEELSLSIVERIIVRHGGSIQARNDETGKTAFYFSFGSSATDWLAADSVEIQESVL